MGVLAPNPPLTDFSPQHTVDHEDPMTALMTTAEYRESVKCGAFIDDDGYGHPVAKFGERYCEDQRHDIVPSMKGADIPPEATHINWFNK